MYIQMLVLVGIHFSTYICHTYVSMYILSLRFGQYQVKTLLQLDTKCV